MSKNQHLIQHSVASILQSLGMQSSEARAFSSSGELVSAPEDSKAQLVPGVNASSEERSDAFSISWEGMSAEYAHRGDSDLPSSSAHAQKSKHERYKVTDTRCLGTNLDPGLWSGLDDHLLEKIFARLPFKSLFQVSSLSKTWRLRISSHSFQSEVQHSLSAFTWNSYAPLYLTHGNDLLGCESGSRQWHKLAAHSYLQQDGFRDWLLRDAAGPLLCWSCPVAGCSKVFHISVTNPLTRSRKQLPPRPEMSFPSRTKIDWDEGSKTYKVVVFKLMRHKTLNDQDCVSVQIFDSTDDSWTVESYKVLTVRAMTYDSFLTKGIFYVWVFSSGRNAGNRLISFDLKEKIWNEIPFVCLVVDEDQKPHRPLKIATIRFSKVLACGSHVMVLMKHMDSDPHDNSGEVYSVFRLDLERGLAFEVSRVPLEMLHIIYRTLPYRTLSYANISSDDNCLYIGAGPRTASLLYNVESREWDLVSASQRPPSCLRAARPFSHRWMPVLYRPGLNPFAKV